MRKQAAGIKVTSLRVSLLALALGAAVAGAGHVMSAETVASAPADVPEETIVYVAPVPVMLPSDKKAVEYIRSYNNGMSDEAAFELWQNIQQTVETFHSDPNYSNGSAKDITPEVVLSMVLKESGAKWFAYAQGEESIGLMQVRDIHVPDLHSVGILEEKSTKELWLPDTNIRAGVYILMSYAQGARDTAQALCFYNAGPSREKAGVKYARRVLALAEKIKGGAL